MQITVLRAVFVERISLTRCDVVQSRFVVQSMPERSQQTSDFSVGRCARRAQANLLSTRRGSPKLFEQRLFDASIEPKVSK